MNYPQANVTWDQLLRQAFTDPSPHNGGDAATVATLVLRTVEDHIRHSQGVRNHLQRRQESGICCPASSPLDEIVEYVANQQGSIDKSNPELNLHFLQALVFPMIAFEREVMQQALNSSNLTRDELLVLEWSFELARATDALWQAWFEQIVVRPFLLDETGRGASKKLIDSTLPTYDYTVYSYDPFSGLTGRQTWAQAFPYEIHWIRDTLSRLKSTPLPGLAAYFSALDTAFDCKHINQLETVWKAVDVAWVRIPKTARLVPMHGIESGYEHSHGVSPEFRLEIRGSGTAELVQRLTAAMTRSAALLDLSGDLVSDLRNKISRTDIDLFVTAIRAGTSANFRYAGQACPNRQDVLAIGGRIFVDGVAPRLKTRLYREKVRDHCAPDTRETLLPLITESAQHAATIAHEFGHFMGRTPESDEKVGRQGMSLLEEAKATLCGVSANELSDPSAESRLVIVANTTARLLRFMQAGELSDQTAAPYIRENLAIATLLFESGVLEFDRHGVAVNTARAQETTWFKMVGRLATTIIAAYQEGNSPALEALTAQYCNKEHPGVGQLIAWVNRE